MKIAILGAERTGKTQLEQTLTQALVRGFEGIPPENVLIADAPALMAAIYRDVLFNDASLYSTTLDQHRSYDLTLLMGLDLPWVANHGVQRNGACSQKSMDARLRAILESNAMPYSIVYGTGAHRTECALQAIAHHMKRPSNTQPRTPSRWQWSCEKCSDSGCEHRIFSNLVHGDSVRE